MNDVLLSSFASQVYRAAQRVDEWPGEDYDGTSVLAGAKVMKDDAYYTEYWWAFGIDSVLLGIAYTGPVVFGIPWLESMFAPRPSGLLEVHGSVAGGHAIRGRGVRLRAILAGEGPKPIEVIRLTNSWGRDYGIGGDVFIRVEDMERLLNSDGEACFPVEPGQRQAHLDE